MSHYLILREVRLKKTHEPTGKTHHYYGDKEIAPPSKLQVVKYPNDMGYYLLYFDEHDRELTDTYHDSLEGAIAQAEWEFQIQTHEWYIVHSPEHEM
jgi:hypothetical protein